jgi:hypothetical protein
MSFEEFDETILKTLSSSSIARKASVLDHSCLHLHNMHLITLFIYCFALTRWVPIKDDA